MDVDHKTCLMDCGFFTCEALMIKPQAQHRRRPMFNIPVSHSLYVFHAEGCGTREGGENRNVSKTADIWAVYTLVTVLSLIYSWIIGCFETFNTLYCSYNQCLPEILNLTFLKQEEEDRW